MEIQELTHITDDMVKGRHFDEDRVAAMLAGRPLVIAHNAAFDRPFFDRRFPALSDLSWGCSLKEVNWDALGSNGTKLEYLNLSRGWFYNAHRAYVDCLALIWIMHIEPEAFSMLVEHALKKTCRVLAVGSPFDVKDKLKAQGYRYDGQRKTWYIDVPSEEEAQRQIAWLQGIYNASQAVIEIFTAKNRFKTR